MVFKSLSINSWKTKLRWEDFKNHVVELSYHEGEETATWRGAVTCQVSESGLKLGLADSYSGVLMFPNAFSSPVEMMT